MVCGHLPLSIRHELAGTIMIFVPSWQGDVTTYTAGAQASIITVLGTSACLFYSINRVMDGSGTKIPTRLAKTRGCPIPQARDASKLNPCHKHGTCRDVVRACPPGRLLHNSD